jgi:NAD(P)-dependent dehydrogenase (short-subunit alcohol dehydrogenase family)
MKDLARTIALAGCLALSLSVSSTVAAAGKPETVLITGANRGLGLEFAREFSARGFMVIGTARKPHEAYDLQALNVRVEQLDVTDPDSVEGLASRLDGVPIDILINNAGIIGSKAPTFVSLDVDELDKTFQVNSLGPMRVTQALFDNLKMTKTRKIIQITSDLGSISLNSRGGLYGYRMSKAALNMFNKTLADELGGEGFICVVLNPGWVQTDIGGRNAPLTPQESISAMIMVIEKLKPTDNGRFLNYKGKELPW